MKLELCGVRQECPANKLNLTQEVEKRELDSYFQKLNKLRVGDLKSTPSRSGLQTMRSNKNVRKTYWLKDVQVKENGNQVTVTFSDGHIETFQPAEVWMRYPTLRPSDYGPTIQGTFEHPNTGTLHLVNTDDELVCGRRNNIQPQNLIPLNTSADDITYNTFCSQCTTKYDGLITKAADLSLSLR